MKAFLRSFRKESFDKKAPNYVLEGSSDERKRKCARMGKLSP